MTIEGKREKWVQINKIQGYEDIRDCYWISNSDEDKIMNKNTGKMKKIWIDKDGYKRVKLMTKDGKMKNCGVHVLKAKGFIYGPNPLGANVVRHLDDCKTNNALTNLAFGTVSDNIRDSIRNGNYNYEAAARGRAKGRIKGGKIAGTITGAKNGKRSSKAVRCIETGTIYPSTKEAERQTGINNGHISECCNGKCKTAGGFHFEFVDKE